MLKRLLILISAIIVLIGIGFAIFGNNPSNKKQLPQTSATIQQGTSLNYSGRGLTHFPKEILSKTNTINLDLSNNKLTGALPGEIKNLKMLEVLNVSNNQMTGIPAEIGQLLNLKVLNYSNNRITGLPLELGNLTQLEILDLSGNPNISQQDLGQIHSKLANTQIKL